MSEGDSILIFHHYFLFADKKCIFANKDNNRHKIITKKGLSIIDYSNIDLGISKYHFEIGPGEIQL